MESQYPSKTIQQMLNALGISYVKSGAHIQPNTAYKEMPLSYRNYYQVNQSDNWDNLVKLKYAKFVSNESMKYYYVTEKGKEYLRNLGYEWEEWENKHFEYHQVIK